MTTHQATYTLDHRGWWVDCSCGYTTGPYGERQGAEDAWANHLRHTPTDPTDTPPPEDPGPPW